MVHDVTTNDIHYHEYCVKKGNDYFKRESSNCVVIMKSPVANANQFNAPNL